jgi:dTDP-4-amino-4,6-dideoxygalactose transaminase
LADHIRTLRVHGGKPKYYHLTVGGNFRLDALQAAVLNVKLDYLDAWQQERQDNARRYRTLFTQSGLVDTRGVHLPEAVSERAGSSYTHTYHQFVIRVPDRDNLRTYLEQNGIGTEVYYPIPLHLQPCFAALGYREGDFPEAERAAQETLALPIYPGLGEQRQRLVVRAIQDFYLPVPA